jgi:glycosyltransferase involved in cell wall biosynthesis
LYWIVTELFYPDEVSTAQILTDIAIYKSRHNKVSIICGPAGYESSYGSQLIELDRNISINRVNLPKLNKNNLVQRILRLLLLTLKLSWAVLTKAKNGDTVLFTTNPTFLVLILPIIKKINGFKLEILVHDVFPENLVPAGLINKDNYKYKLLNWIYSSGYNNLDRIIVLGQDMKNLILGKIGTSAINIEIISNWSDDNLFPIKNFNIGEYLGIDVEDKVVLTFSGNIGRVQGVLEFIDVIEKADNKNLILVIIGDGALRELVVNKIRNERISNVFYLGAKRRAEQNLFLNACHISLVTLINGMKGLGVPSKTYNYLAVGKPILFIGDKDSEVDNYIKKHDCGWSFSWDEEDSLISFLRELSIVKKNEFEYKADRAIHFSKNFIKEDLIKLF